MPRSAALVCALAIGLLPATRAQAQAAPVAATPPVFSPDECAVWARELSFARSVADHDVVAFAAHVHAGAAFGASRATPTRGRDTITQRWAGIISGKAGHLYWYPTRTTIGGAGDVAWSSGPSLFEDLDPDAKDRYSLGMFHSVWHRDTDGVWRVLFDDGVPPKAATPAEVAAFHAGRKGPCPQG